ncbi:type VII secretion protein EccB, partial [Kitasatospora indigofera]|uniref:type VII secretion protein EccB n=1 Tax=Kitasatospora indigofera TaxID=67307 RepID=UPI0036888366
GGGASVYPWRYVRAYFGRLGVLWVSARAPSAYFGGAVVPQRGEPGPQVGALKTRIGQVLESRAGTSEASVSRFLVLPDGLAPLSAIEASLVLGDPKTKDAYPGGTVAAAPVGASDAATAPASKRSAPTGLPLTPPDLTSPVVGQPRTPCVRMVLRPDAAVASVEVTLAEKGTAGREGTAGRTPSGGPILLAPGSGMLAQAPVSAGDTSTKAYLVTDLGVKYPLPSLDAAGALGYSGSGAGMVTVPASLLDLLPTGPVLDPQAAAREYAPGK